MMTLYHFLSMFMYCTIDFLELTQRMILELYELESLSLLILASRSCRCFTDPRARYELLFSIMSSRLFSYSSATC